MIKQSKLRIIALGLVFTMLVVRFNTTVCAFNAEKHNEYLISVLFGDISYYDNLHSESKKDKIQMLEYASYLAIDQCRGEGADELSFLKKKRVKRLPELAEIDLTGVFYGSHRNYTHRGWDFEYQKNLAHWDTRKNLLCSTINKMFCFGLKNELFGNVCKQCDSFGALVYYVHILGDHIAKHSYETNDLMIPLAREHADYNNLDVFMEIKTHCEILFSSQRNSRTYADFMLEMDNLAEQARILAGTEGGINKSNFEQYQRYAAELMDILISYVPLLLENEDFFQSAFYVYETRGE